MCYNCDCGDPNDTMGNDHNITNQITLTNLASKWNIPFDQVRQTVYQDLVNEQIDAAQKADVDHMYDVASKAWGQTVQEARANTLKLLKRELNIQ